MSQITTALETIISETFTTYKGVLITIIGGKFECLRNKYDSLKEAQDAIDEGFKIMARGNWFPPLNKQ